MKKAKVGVIGDGSSCEVSFLASYIAQKQIISPRSIFEDCSYETTHAGALIRIQLSQLAGLNYPFLVRNALKNMDAFVCCIYITDKNERQALDALEGISKVKHEFIKKGLVVFIVDDKFKIKDHSISLLTIACQTINVKYTVCSLGDITDINSVFDTTLSMINPRRHQEKPSKSHLFNHITDDGYEADIEDNVVMYKN